MHITQVAEHIYLIDLETAGIKNSFASYVLKGKQVAIVETGPTSSIPNLISSLKTLNVKPEDVAYVAVTHIHLDHGGGVGTLLNYLPKAKVIVHQRGAPHLVNPEKLWPELSEIFPCHVLHPSVVLIHEEIKKRPQPLSLHIEITGRFDQRSKFFDR